MAGCPSCIVAPESNEHKRECKAQYGESKSKPPSCRGDVVLLLPPVFGTHLGLSVKFHGEYFVSKREVVGGRVSNTPRQHGCIRNGACTPHNGQNMKNSATHNVNYAKAVRPKADFSSPVCSVGVLLPVASILHWGYAREIGDVTYR